MNILRFKSRKILRYTIMLFATFFTLASYSETKPIGYQKIITQAYEKYKNNNEGDKATYIPELQNANAKNFGIALMTVDGKLYHVGDTNVRFPIESISKVFILALAIKEHGSNNVLQKIGANPTGMPFNSITAIELEKGRTGNGLLNAGAIATISLLKSADKQKAWGDIIQNMGLFSGEDLTINKKVYISETNTNQRNRAIAHLLKSYHRLYSAPKASVDLYTKVCSVNVSTRQLAIMATTLANHGENPLTHKKVISPEAASKVITMISIAGMYNNSGNWLYQTGVPAKSGVSGGLIAIVPGKFAIATFSPRLDKYGNSVRGQLATKYILRKLKQRVL